MIKKEEKMNFKQWNGFVEGDWKTEINVRDFIQKNYTPYANRKNKKIMG